MFSSQASSSESLDKSLKVDTLGETIKACLKDTPDAFQKNIYAGYLSLERELRNSFKNDSKNMNGALDILKKLHRTTNAYLEDYLSKATATDKDQIECMIRVIFAKEINSFDDANGKDDALLIEMIKKPRMLLCSFNFQTQIIEKYVKLHKEYQFEHFTKTILETLSNLFMFTPALPFEESCESYLSLLKILVENQEIASHLKTSNSLGSFKLNIPSMLRACERLDTYMRNGFKNTIKEFYRIIGEEMEELETGSINRIRKSSRQSTNKATVQSKTSTSSSGENKARKETKNSKMEVNTNTTNISSASTASIKIKTDERVSAPTVPSLSTKPQDKPTVSNLVPQGTNKTVTVVKQIDPVQFLQNVSAQLPSDINSAFIDKKPNKLSLQGDKAVMMAIRSAVNSVTNKIKIVDSADLPNKQQKFSLEGSLQQLHDLFNLTAFKEKLAKIKENPGQNNTSKQEAKKALQIDKASWENSLTKAFLECKGLSFKWGLDDKSNDILVMKLPANYVWNNIRQYKASHTDIHTAIVNSEFIKQYFSRLRKKLANKAELTLVDDFTFKIKPAVDQIELLTDIQEEVFTQLVNNKQIVSVQPTVKPRENDVNPQPQPTSEEVDLQPLTNINLEIQPNDIVNQVIKLFCDVSRGIYHSNFSFLAVNTAKNNQSFFTYNANQVQVLTNRQINSFEFFTLLANCINAHYPDLQFKVIKNSVKANEHIIKFNNDTKMLNEVLGNGAMLREINSQFHAAIEILDPHPTFDQSSNSEDKTIVVIQSSVTPADIEFQKLRVTVNQFAFENIKDCHLKALLDSPKPVPNKNITNEPLHFVLFLMHLLRLLDTLCAFTSANNREILQDWRNAIRHHYDVVSYETFYMTFSPFIQLMQSVIENAEMHGTQTSGMFTDIKYYRIDIPVDQLAEDYQKLPKQTLHNEDTVERIEQKDSYCEGYHQLLEFLAYIDINNKSEIEIMIHAMIGETDKREPFGHVYRVLGHESFTEPFINVMQQLNHTIRTTNDLKLTK